MKGGFFVVLSFIAMNSINLGIINLLPIPMLDGGYLFQYIIETALRRSLNPEIQIYATAVRTVFLLYIQQQAFVKQILLSESRQQYLFGCCVYSLELLMMDGKTVRNM